MPFSSVKDETSMSSARAGNTVMIISARTKKTRAERAMDVLGIRIRGCMD
jgi:hypothetical protein